MMILKIRYSDFDHFRYIALNEILSLKNTSDNTNSGKKIRFIFFNYLIKCNKTGGNLWCWKRARPLNIQHAIENAWGIFIVSETK